MSKPHHTFLQTIGNLHSKDSKTEWWTVTNESKFYEMRDQIPFENLFCSLNPGGLVVYLDKPSKAECWRSMVERALGLEPDPVNHTLEWAYEAILCAREAGNRC